LFLINTAVSPDLDNARLHRSFEYFVEHYGIAELITSAPRVVAMAIANFVEATQDFCGERVAEIDRDLRKRDAYTLSVLREYFTRRPEKSDQQSERPID
jgi:hypothetical protein